MMPLHVKHLCSAPPCDCCGRSSWQHLFTERGVDLGRCDDCGLHYVAQMPSLETRMTELDAGHFVEVDLRAKRHRHGESLRHREFERYVGTAQRDAVHGPWLDIGCGAGMLLLLARRSGREIFGIELTRARRTVAQEITGVPIYDRPLEHLNIPAKSLAVITLINVFSHLVSPMRTLSEIRRLLLPGGIVILRTGEIGRGVQQRHAVTWGLGDHLYFLGEGTIDRYAKKLGYTILQRERAWLPETLYSRDWFSMKGASRVRNVAKSAILHTPGALPLLRWYVCKHRQADNPIHSSTFVLRPAM
jgi:SAM-dependent methyltransferase